MEAEWAQVTASTPHGPRRIRNPVDHHALRRHRLPEEAPSLQAEKSISVRYVSPIQQHAWQPLPALRFTSKSYHRRFGHRCPSEHVSPSAILQFINSPSQCRYFPLDRDISPEFQRMSGAFPVVAITRPAGASPKIARLQHKPGGEIGQTVASMFRQLRPRYNPLPAN